MFQRPRRPAIPVLLLFLLTPLVSHLGAQDSSGTNSPSNKPEETADGTARDQSGLPDYRNVKKEFPEVPFYFFSSRSIRIDVRVEESSVRLKSADLWISRNNGRNWQKARGAEDGSNRRGWYIDYQFPEEGLYGIQTVGTDVAGNKTKPPRSGEHPDMFVYIDRHSPEVNISSNKKDALLPPSTNTVPVNWTVQDPTLDPSSIRVSVSRDAGNSWEVFSKGRESVKEQEVEFRGSDELLFRVEARDRAGNRVVHTTDKPLRRATNWAHYRTGVKNGYISPPHASKTRQVKISYSPPPPENKEDPSKNLQVTLHYTIDGGASWKRANVKHLRDEQAVRFSAPDDGYYGFYVNFSYPNSEPYREDPEAGTEPDYRTLIDTKSPSVDLLAPKAREKLNPGEEVDVIYQAYDAYLPEKPVTLYYSVDDGETWKVIKKDLVAEGVYTWTVPDHPTSGVRIKAEVRDLADHVSSATSPEPLYIPGDSEKSPARIRNLTEATTEQVDQTDQGKEGTEDGEDMEQGEDDSEAEEEKSVTNETIEDWLDRAEKLKEKNKLENAVRVYRRILQYRSNSIKALEALARLLYRLGRYAESEAMFRRVLSLKQDDDPSYLLYNLGCTLYMQEKFEKSSGFLRRALDGGLVKEYRDTAAPRVTFEKLIEIAHQFLRQNRREKALNLLDKLKKRDDLRFFPAIRKKIDTLLEKHST